MFVCMISMPGAALCEEFPETLLGLIKEGSHIGLSVERDGSLRHITLLTESETQLVRDVQELEQPALLAKYQKLAEKVEATLKSFVASLKESELPRGTRYGEPKLKVSPGAGALHRIVHVGSDYVLVESQTAEPERFVLNAAEIKKIRWYRGPSISTHVSHVRDDQVDTSVPPRPGK